MFSKRGVGMVLITHFADQLSDIVRRHAQTHFYFKQDVDSLESALKDLKFNPLEEELWRNASKKLLSLPTGVAACRAVHIEKGRRVEVGPFFIKTSEHEEGSLDEKEVNERVERYMKRNGIHLPKKTKLAVRVVSKDGKGIPNAAVELMLCGTPVSFGETQEGADSLTGVEAEVAGSVYLDAVEGEEYELRVSKKGYRTECRKVSAGDGMITVELELSNKAKRANLQV
jgi:hypothetical protein